ncbi:hypothetical protein AXF42_Ash011604 [Apostasia shenzhenica]|uniref:Uncharacterized protein n=1 Tax=Apostasia shenzhenica TaxID=1088818 RepID=A0A2I0BB26_9ASPA|nr:hypothetical protein AXF42_Ash011604 [Apostasia shenzhenica]
MPVQPSIASKKKSKSPMENFFHPMPTIARVGKESQKNIGRKNSQPQELHNFS